MKKLFYLLLMLPLAILASCNNDDDLPEVDLTFTMSGVTQYDDAFYAVRNVGETPSSDTDSDAGTDDVKAGVIRIDGLTAKTLTNQNAGVANVIYYLDGLALPVGMQAPFICEIPTADLQAGNHMITVMANVLQVDKSMATASLSYLLRVVENADDLPEGAPEIGTYSFTTRLQHK